MRTITVESPSRIHTRFSLHITLFSMIIFLILLSTLFSTLSQPVSATTKECSLKHNLPDSDYSSRVSSAEDLLDSFYAQYVSELGRESVVPEAKPYQFAASLYFFLRGEETRANAFLHDLSLDSSRQAVYLAWITTFKGLNSTKKSTIENNINSFQFSTSESDVFLKEATSYLISPDHESSDLISLLKAKGEHGWASENDVSSLVDVVVGLSALLSSDFNPDVQRLAEMNLDIIFARFAVHDAQGAFTGLVLNDSPTARESYALTPAEAIWAGWSDYLFGGDSFDESYLEPAILAYVPSAEIRALHGKNDVVSREGVVDQGGNVIGHTFSYKSADYIIGGAVDVGNRVSGVDVTRASVRFLDDPQNYITFTTTTTGSGEDESALLTTKDLIMGELKATSCGEAHVLIGGGLKGEGINIKSAKGVTVLKHNSDYFALLFLKDQHLLNLSDRYTPLDPYSFGNEIKVIIPFTYTPEEPVLDGYFAFEPIPDSFINDAGSDLEKIASAVASKVSLTRDNDSGLLTYNSTAGETYKYNPKELTTPNIQSSSLGTEPREAHTSSAGTPLISEEGGVWRIGASSSSDKLTLDFSSGTKSASSSIYGCLNTTLEDNDSGSLSEPLSFLSASILPESGQYRMICAPNDELLSNKIFDQSLDSDLIKGGCALKSDGDTTVGVIYDPNANGGVPSVIDQLGSFSPFTSEPPDSSLCGDVDDNNSNFTYCGKIKNSGLSKDIVVWVNGKYNIVLFSTDPSPTGSASSPFSWFTDWFNELFGLDLSFAGEAPAHSFDKAYFGRGANGEEVEGFVKGSEQEDYFTNFSSNLESFGGGLDSPVLYKAGGSTQKFSSPTQSMNLLKGFRLKDTGTPVEFGGCGDGQIQTGEDCDDGNLFNGDGCNDTCGTECLDNDGDGFYAMSGCGTPVDCDDSNPSIYPGATEDQTNEVDDNCNGFIDESNDEVPVIAPGECSEDAQASCSAICNVTLPPVTMPCPTEPFLAFVKGEYNFTAWLNNDSYPVLKITPSNKKLDGNTQRCNWGGEVEEGLEVRANKKDNPITITWEPDSEGLKKRFFRFRWFIPGGSPTLHANAKVFQLGYGWNLTFTYKGSAPSKYVNYVKDCWDLGSLKGKNKQLSIIIPVSNGACEGYPPLSNGDAECTSDDYCKSKYGSSAICVDDDDNPTTTGGYCEVSLGDND